MRKKLNKKRLKDNEKSMVDELCESIIIASHEDKWEDL